MNTINAVKSVPRIKTILGNTCKDLESYLLHLGHKWCPWNRGFSNERFIVVVLFFVASCTTSKFWRTQDLMSAFLKQLRKKNLSFYLVICTFICGSYESTGKCHAGFIFLFFCYLLYAVYLFSASCNHCSVVNSKWTSCCQTGKNRELQYKCYISIIKQ